MKSLIKSKLVTIVICLLSFSFFSCENQPIIGQDNDIKNEADNEVAYINKKGKAVEIKLGRHSIKVEEIEGLYVLGDILIDKEDVLLTQNKSTGRVGSRWLDNTVYYTIKPSLPNQSRITEAIAHWETNTSLKFVKRTNQSDYIYFTDEGGCSSFVGRQGGRQNVNIGIYCTLGNTIHEIGHAIGLWHEQSRKDRDQFITVNFQNISRGAEYNFQSYVEQGIDGDEYTSTLDLNSIMMYDSFTFTTDLSKPTIVKKDGTTFQAQRDGLSPGDLEGIRVMYPSSPNDNDICKGIAPYNSNNRYQTGDRVIYRESLYERTDISWNWIGSCNS